MNSTTEYIDNNNDKNNNLGLYLSFVILGVSLLKFLSTELRKRYNKNKIEKYYNNKFFELSNK